MGRNNTNSQQGLHATKMFYSQYWKNIVLGITLENQFCPSIRLSVCPSDQPIDYHVLLINALNYQCLQA